MTETRDVKAGGFVTLCAVVLLGTSTGCAEPVGEADRTRSPSTSASGPTSTPSPLQTSEPEPDPTTGSIVKRIGETTEYVDGLLVTVVSATRQRLSTYAAGRQRGGVDVVVTVKITNRMSATWDASLVQIDLKSGTEGNAAPRRASTAPRTTSTDSQAPSRPVGRRLPATRSASCLPTSATSPSRSRQTSNTRPASTPAACREMTDIVSGAAR